MTWHVAYTKPRSEIRAQENLLAQGFEVYLPMMKAEKIVRGQFTLVSEPLFARYLFLRETPIMNNWSVIRSTKGVSHLLRFGMGSEPVTVPIEVIEQIVQAINALELAEPRELKSQSLSDNARGGVKLVKRTLFTEGQGILVKNGPFVGLTGIFQKITATADGEARALILLELLGKPQLLNLSLASLSTAVA